MPKVRKVEIVKDKVHALEEEIQDEIEPRMSDVESDIQQIKFALFFILGLGLGDFIGIKTFIQSLL